MVAAASSSAISVAAIFPAVLIGLVYLTRRSVRRSLSSWLRVNDMLPFNQMSLDSKRRLLAVGAGARWADIVPFLDHQGLAVAVMQSNNDFTVGGSLSVNCHGWQHNSRPIASTVESFRLATAAGEIITCSRTENQELFTLVLGGYGLFGVILTVGVL
jgi:FAD/FMN-containing dehydrogenase